MLQCLSATKLPVLQPVRARVQPFLRETCSAKKVTSCHSFILGDTLSLECTGGALFSLRSSCCSWWLVCKHLVCLSWHSCRPSSPPRTERAALTRHTPVDHRSHPVRRGQEEVGYHWTQRWPIIDQAISMFRLKVCNTLSRKGSKTSHIQFNAAKGHRVSSTLSLLYVYIKSAFLHTHTHVHTTCYLLTSQASAVQSGLPAQIMLSEMRCP